MFEVAELAGRKLFPLSGVGGAHIKQGVDPTGSASHRPLGVAHPRTITQDVSLLSQRGNVHSKLPRQFS